MKYYIYAPKDMVISIDGYMKELDAGKTILINENSIIAFYPLQKNYLSFVAVCSSANIFKNNNVKTTSYENFIILEPIFPQIFSAEIIFGKSFKELTACLTGKPYSFLIEKNGISFSHKCPEILTNIEISEVADAILLQAESNEQDYVVAFHKTQQKFYEFVGDFSIENNVITLVKDKQTFARHGEILKYEIAESEITAVSCEPVYINGAPARHAPFLNHIAFFEAVREKDFNLASKYLTPILKEQLTPVHYENFFGNFDEIKPLTLGDEHKIALIENKNLLRSEAKTYKLKFEQSLISDIENA